MAGAKVPVFSRVDPSLAVDIERLAKANDRSVASMLRIAIREGVAVIEQKQRHASA